MMEFFRKIFTWLTSIFRKGSRINISGKNSTNINGDGKTYKIDINIGGNINIANNYIGGMVKFENDENFLILSSLEEEYNNRKYRILHLDGDKKGSCTLFIEGEIPVVENLSLVVRSIESKNEIKNGNYFIMEKKDETQIPE